MVSNGGHAASASKAVKAIKPGELGGIASQVRELDQRCTRFIRPDVGEIVAVVPFNRG